MTLICLISGQLTPNLLSVIELKPVSVILVHTLDTIENAKSFSGLIQNRYSVQNVDLIEVPPFNASAILEKAESLAKSLDTKSTITLNYTGGTKPMSIQFVRVFEDLGARLLYVDTQQECFWWTEKNNTTKEEFDFRFPITTLFDLRNVSIRSQTDKNNIESLKELTEFMIQQKAKLKSPKMNAFIKEAVNVQIKNRPLDKWNPKVKLDSLQIEPVPHKSDKINVYWRNELLTYKNKSFWLDYFTGGWFEHWTFLILSETEIYDDIRCNLTIKPNETETKGSIKNEIDVAAIYNAIPIFFECKTGRVDQKSITNLKAIVDEYGPKYSVGVIVSFYPIKDSVIKEKINDYNFKLIEGADQLTQKLQSLHEEVVVRT